MFPKSEPPPALRGFEILERLGAGGAGQVFLARSRGGKLVAIKTLADESEASHDEAFKQTLAREASLCVRLNHPAIVQVRAFVEEDGFAALVFEYVEGVALVRLLRFCARHGVRLPDRAAWFIVERVLAALAYAHAQTDEAYQPAPIVHRDVSPSNVLVDWMGGVKLADFGMAKMIGVSPSTRVGLVKGTLGCMAPEQARGEEVTERADVYAAALLAWRLATGRTPFARFKDDEYELLRAMRNPRLRPLAALRPDLPEPVLSAIGRALEPEVKNRSITADELRAIVRANVDADAGRVDLATLLGRWRPALVKTVARDDSHASTGRRDERDGAGERDAGDARDESDERSGGERGHKTGRYDEAALAFDNEAGGQGLLDAPTFETYSLPSDDAILATLPVDGAIEVAMPAASGASAPASTSNARHDRPDSGPPLPPPATVESIPATISTAPPRPPAPPARAFRTDIPSVPPPAFRSPGIRSGRKALAAFVLVSLAVVCAVAAYVAK